MTVELTPEAAQLLSEQMASGEYPDASAVVAAALARLAESAVPPFDEAMLDALEEAERDIESGRVHDWDDVKQQFMRAHGED